MQPSRPVKFNFDTVFGEPAPGARPRSTFSASEVETIRRETFAEGKAETEAQAAAARAATLGAIAQGTMRLIGELDGVIANLRQESAAVALQVGRKLAEQALAAYPLHEVEALIADCLHKLHGEPRIVVRVSEKCAEALRTDIDTLAAASGYAGRIVILAEPSLADADCRVEWADGGIERDLAHTFSLIEQRAERWRATPPVES